MGANTFNGAWDEKWWNEEGRIEGWEAGVVVVVVVVGWSDGKIFKAELMSATERLISLPGHAPPFFLQLLPLVGVEWPSDSQPIILH